MSLMNDALVDLAQRQWVAAGAVDVSVDVVRSSRINLWWLVAPLVLVFVSVFSWQHMFVGDVTETQDTDYGFDSAAREGRGSSETRREPRQSGPASDHRSLALGLRAKPCFTNACLAPGGSVAESLRAPGASANFPYPYGASMLQTVSEDPRPSRSVPASGVLSSENQTVAVVESVPSLELWLEKIDLSISRQRLSVPAENNALYFLALAELDYPGHPEVELRREAVRSQYLVSLENALAAGQIDFARKLLDRYAQFGFSAEMLSKHSAQLRALQQNVLASQQDAVELPQDAPVLQKNVVISQQTVVKPVSSVTHEEEVATIKIETSLATRDSEQVQLLRSALGSGSEASALAAGIAFLGEYPAAIQSGVLLCDVFAERGDVVRLQALLAVLPVAGDLYPYAQAKLALLSDDVAGAMQILESVADGSAVNVPVRLLLGGLYHRGQRHHEARGHYQRILRVHGAHPQALLGAALASDAMGEGVEARGYFQQLLRVGHPDAAVLRYAQERTRQLSALSVSESASW